MVDEVSIPELPSERALIDICTAPAWKSDAISGSRTPAYGADGARTVNPYTEGNRTAYGGAGGVRPPSVPGTSSTLANIIAENACV